MEVTFSASGAINRAHYALVQKVESAADPGLADDAIVHEIDAIRARFARPTFSPASSQCRDWLLILLYCGTALTYELPRPDYFEFALPAAVGLAEGGTSLSDRRVGYQYCVSVMPKDHELHLMLVNTYRKDLDCHDEPQICLALDMLIQASTADVIPAIENRLEDLLSHKSFYVKSRVMAVFKALSQHNPDILVHTKRKIQKRLRDDVVSEATLALSVELCKAKLFQAEDILPLIVDLIRRRRAKTGTTQQPCTRGAIRVVGQLVALDPSTSRVDELAKVIIRTCIHSAKSHNIVLECFRALAYVPLAVLQGTISSDLAHHPISSIRPLLFSKEPNHQYLLLRCLLTLDVSLWVGTDEAIPPQLDENEVHRIMSFLDSNDPTIRSMTARLLHRIDPMILESYLVQFVSTIPSPTKHSLAMCENYASRALELSEIIDVSGEAYAKRLIDTMRAVQTTPGGEAEKVRSPSKRDPVLLDAEQQAGWGMGAKAVLESAVELVLVKMKLAPEIFQATFTEVICRGTFDGASTSVPTTTVICAAVTCEYGGLPGVTMPQQEILQGLAGCLNGSGAGVQEALLVAMTRTAARCETLPDAVASLVSALAKSSRRHIRNRCDQFLRVTKDLLALNDVMKKAKSSSLPDVLQAVEAYIATLPKEAKPALSSAPYSPSPSSRAISPRPPQKLRYEAYDAPQPTQPQKTRRFSNPTAVRQAPPSPNPAIGPGFLALVAGEDDMLMSRSSGKVSTPRGHVPALSMESVAARIDLISLESPFHAEPASASDGAPSAPTSPTANLKDPESFRQRFEATWEAIGTTSRGWCSAPPSAVTTGITGLGFVLSVLEMDVFDNSARHESREILGLLPSPVEARDILAAIRLRPGDEDSCLWILKCDRVDLKDLIKEALQRDG